jgi:hypothetical protein
MFQEASCSLQLSPEVMSWLVGVVASRRLSLLRCCGACANVWNILVSRCPTPSVAQMVERSTVVVDAVRGILRNRLVTSSILVVRTSFGQRRRLPTPNDCLPATKRVFTTSHHSLYCRRSYIAHHVYFPSCSVPFCHLRRWYLLVLCCLLHRLRTSRFLGLRLSEFASSPTSDAGDVQRSATLDLSLPLAFSLLSLFLSYLSLSLYCTPVSPHTPTHPTSHCHPLLLCCDTCVSWIACRGI